MRHDTWVHVLIAAGPFGDLLTAAEVTEAIALGWSLGAGHDVIDTLPLPDGGPGFVAVLAEHFADQPGIEVELVAVTTRDPWGRPTPATVLLVTDAAGWRTAYLEAAEVCGAQLRREHDELTEASSAGLGQALSAAVDLAASSVVLGLSGSIVTDGGLGLAAGLSDPDGLLGSGPAGLERLTGTSELTPIKAARARLATAGVGGVRISGLGELGTPLLGLQGVAAGLADRDQGQRIERALGHAVDLIARELPGPVDLVTGERLRPHRAPGAGAGHGLGYALMLLGGQVLDGPAAGCRLVGLDRRVAAADLLVTGDAVLGWEALRGGSVTAAAAVAADHGVPVVAIAGQLSAGRRETLAAGLSGVYAACDSLADWPAFAADPQRLLTVRAEAVARTWSPPGRPR